MRQGRPARRVRRVSQDRLVRPERPVRRVSLGPRARLVRKVSPDRRVRPARQVRRVWPGRLELPVQRDLLVPPGQSGPRAPRVQPAPRVRLELRAWLDRRERPVHKE